MAITDDVTLYINKSNNKIAEISSIATDLLEKTGCNCDISGYVDDILDINTSMFIIDKRWQNIEDTFGFKNFLVSLYSEDKINNEVLSFMDKYIIRYNMNDASAIVYPLISYFLPGFDSGLSFDNYNNIVRVIYIDQNLLSGIGTLEEQISAYINANITISITSLNSKVNIVLT